MSDYFGPNQTRVLDSDNRNFEEVIYQKKKPPLSCEVNLNGKVAADKAQFSSHYMSPSGWSIVGALKNDVSELSCGSGDVLCSSSISANSFKLMALDKGIEIQDLRAMVNGWNILVQGTNSLDENNIIILPAPPSIGYRIDFVFLEVWRKLISTTDVIYKHGNVLYGGQNYQNDLIDPAIGIETSLRVQLQYRIRVADCDLESYPDGFDPNKVFVQGPLSTPINTCSHAWFSQVPGDIGLWRAGIGDSAAQEALGTVDGYTYAIPLFAIQRRNTGAYNPDTRSNGSAVTLAEYLTGYPSDRPDNLYNNWIVATDILDMRHRVYPSENLKEIAEDGFMKLINGRIRGIMEKQTLGEDHFGTILVQADSINNIDRAGSTRIAEGDGQRRIFTNAGIDQSETLNIKTVNDKTVGSPGTNWAIGDQVQISIVSYPVGTQITSVQQLYRRNGSGGYVVMTPVTDYTLSTIPSNILTITVPSGSALVGNSLQFYIEYTVTFATGQNGFTRVPEQMLEFRNENSSESYALPGMDIRVRTSDPVVTTDGTRFNMLSNKGGNTTQLYDFGHQMIYHMLGNGTQVVTFPRTLEGFQIIGVVSAKISSVYCTPSVTRTSTDYTVDLGTPAALGADVELVLYTGGKFFEVNRQGRGIIESYEMAELRSFEAANGSLVTFHVDSTTKPIMGMASGYNMDGAGIAYVNGVQKTLTTTNFGLPTDNTKSVATLTFSVVDTPIAGAVIEFPLLMKSAIPLSEGYAFFYNAVPYQGLLDSTATGAFDAVGPAIVTTSGSGLITDLTYSDGLALFADTTVVNGLGTEWLSNVKPGYVIRSDATPQKEFVISEVYADDVLFLTARTEMSSPYTGEAYTIIAKDRSYFLSRNIIDRLPALDSDKDSTAKNDVISTVVVSDPYPIINTKIMSDVQSIMGLPPNTVTIGANSADRGRSTVQIPEEYAPLGTSTLGAKFESLYTFSDYQKAYQTYILNRDNSGRLYLMVVGTETDNTGALMHLNEKSTRDSVDIFELPGRPLTNRRMG
jgi:hypothetical protein